MTFHESAEDAGTGYDFKAIKKRYIALNEARLARTREALKERQRDFLALLPLLYHTNHPLLPGYVSKETPAGIPGYEPDPDTLDAARRLARGFTYRRSARRRFPILAIYFMGSPGSVAYSEKSDFDIWICHDPALSDTQVTRLRDKGRSIEAWAATLNLEAHFFLINVEKFRRGELQRLSSESSGSAQHNLLLDEFYRTSVWLAGQYPMWWLVPPEREQDYDEYVAEIQSKRFVHARGHIDFGGLAHVPAEEFFGAALWQLYKGIDSPYKSVLKLLLIESYASEYPAMDLLCQRFKRAIYRRDAGVDDLDPYLLMLSKVEEYLGQREEKKRLELARRCFYFKTNAALTTKRLTRSDWRRQLLSARVESWGWQHADLLVMDSHDAWKVHRVSEERRILFDALSESYRFLSEFARRYAGLLLISQQDLNMLGRKLYAAFERKAGKVELLNRGITRDLTESQLSVHEVLDEQGQSSWVLYSGVVLPGDTRRETPIKRQRFIVGLIAWCFFNKVLDRHTAVAVYARHSTLSSKEFRAMVERMGAVFPQSATGESTMDDFAVPARVLKSGIFVNVGTDPFGGGEWSGVQIASGRSDALSFGGGAENLILSLSLVLVTSWQEVLTLHYTEGKGVVECLCEYLKWSPPTKGETPPPVPIYSYGSYRGDTVALRIEALFQALIRCYYEEKRPPETRFVLTVERGYYVIYFDGDQPQYAALEKHSALMRFLASPQPRYVPVVFDSYALPGKVIPAIYERNRPAYVQFFYLPQGDEVDVYVLDERGSLFHQRQPFYDTDSLLSQYSRFFEVVMNRINFLMQEGQAVKGPEGLEFHAIDRDQRGRWQLVRQPPQFRQLGKQYLSLQVIVDVDEQGKTLFTLYCDDREFSTLEFGTGLFDAVVRHVLELRMSGQAYPIYITDISMSRPVLGAGGPGKVQTIHFLTYKKRIEDQLMNAMDRVT